MIAPAPAYQGLCHAVLKNFYVGTSVYIKTLAFEVRRLPNPFGTTDYNIAGDGNPAWMIYDLMTNPVLGLATAPGRFDVESFKACAATLHAEGMGMSMTVDTASQADQVISDICRHIDGVLYTDPQTGLWTMKLARADYDPATLPEFTDADFQTMEDWSRGSLEQTLNEVKIQFTNGATYLADMVQAQETANYAMRGELASSTIAYLGFTKPALAQFVAMRELKGFSYPFLQMRAKANRRAWNFRVASVFKLTWPAYGVDGLVMRVISIDYGSLDDGSIEVTAIEDIFGLQFAGYAAPVESGWTNPVGDPLPPVAQRLLEAPYFMSGADRDVLTLVTRADETSTAYETWVDEGGGTSALGATNEAFTPSALLVSDTGATLVVSSSVDLDECVSIDPTGLLRGDNLLLIDDELVAWQVITDNGDGTFTLGTLIRGCLDTVSASHSAGVRVWMLSNGVGVTQDGPYADDVTLSVRNLPINPSGTCDALLVSPVTLTTASRAARPYPPGNVVVTTGTDNGLTCTWSRRSRLHAGLNYQTDGDVAEAGEGSVTVEVLVGGVVKHTTGGLATSGSGFYSVAQRLLDDLDTTKLVEFRLTPVNGAFSGAVRVTDGVLMDVGVVRFDTFAGTGPLGPEWTTVADASTTLAQYSGAFGPAGAGAGDVWACRNDVAFAPDQSSQMTLLSIGSNGAVGLIVRADPAGGAAASYFFRVGVGLVTGGVPVRNLWKVVSGAYTLLWSDATASVSGDVYVLSVVGSTLTVTCNGAPICSVTDSDIATGAPGIIVTADPAFDARATNWIGRNV
jgi:hypothetical protein